MTAPVADQRSRTIRWSDPLESAERLEGLSGLEAMRALADGTVPPPPIAELLGFRLVEADEGRAVFTGVADEFHYNPIGVVHGGLAATVLDSAMGCSVHTTLRPGEAYTTAELKVNLVRAINGGMPLRCEGTVLYKGRRQATAEGKLLEATTGRLLAHGTTTCLIAPARPAADRTG